MKYNYGGDMMRDMVGYALTQVICEYPHEIRAFRHVICESPEEILDMEQRPNQFLYLYLKNVEGASIDNEVTMAEMLERAKEWAFVQHDLASKTMRLDDIFSLISTFRHSNTTKNATEEEYKEAIRKTAERINLQGGNNPKELCGYFKNTLENLVRERICGAE